MTMKMPTRREVERIKARYTKGLRIELIHMDDPQAPPAGTRGTLITADDGGGLGIVHPNQFEPEPLRVAGFESFNFPSRRHLAGS